MMEKTKLLTFTIIALLLLNFCTLGFLFLSSAENHPPRHGHGPEGRPKPREIIIEKLHFDKEQVVQYDQLIEWHQTTIRETEDKIRKSKNELYLLLNTEPIDEKGKITLIDSLAAYQKQIESTHFKHFGDIKNLCKPNQLKDFEALTEELSGLFSKPQRKPHE